MKILFISDVSIHQVIGGAERVLYEQAVGLRRLGHEVHVMTRRLDTHEALADDIRGVREWRYDVKAQNPLSFLLTTLFNGSRLFRDLEKRVGFDAVNAHQPFSAWAALRGGLGKRPFVYTCHSLSFEEYLSRRRALGRRHRILDTINVHLRKKIEKTVLKKAAGIIVLSSFTKEKLRAVYGIDEGKVAIVPGGVDLGRFHPAAPEERTEIRRRLGLPTDRLVLLTVRNLVPRMGLENLITAMGDVVRSVPAAILVIGGTGPLREGLVRLRDDLELASHIRFAGFIPEEDLPDYYRAADLFVLPTVELEGFGLVTLEALASGTPVLGTPVGGTREILQGNAPGRLFRDTTPSAMAELIIQEAVLLVKEPGRREELSRVCRAFTERNYGWDQNVAATERLLAELRVGLSGKRDKAV